MGTGCEQKQESLVPIDSQTELVRTNTVVIYTTVDLDALARGKVCNSGIEDPINRPLKGYIQRGLTLALLGNKTLGNDQDIWEYRKHDADRLTDFMFNEWGIGFLPIYTGIGEQRDLRKLFPVILDMASPYLIPTDDHISYQKATQTVLQQQGIDTGSLKYPQNLHSKVDATEQFEGKQAELKALEEEKHKLNMECLHIELGMDKETPASRIAENDRRIAELYKLIGVRQPLVKGLRKPHQMWARFQSYFEPRTLILEAKIDLDAKTGDFNFIGGANPEFIEEMGINVEDIPTFNRRIAEIAKQFKETSPYSDEQIDAVQVRYPYIQRVDLSEILNTIKRLRTAKVSDLDIFRSLALKFHTTEQSMKFINNIYDKYSKHFEI